MKHAGSCHCGTVAIEVEAPNRIEVFECNCSICKRTGFLHLIVPATAFRLVHGEENLSVYTFNTGTAKHYFCRLCGCPPFYVPRSNPDGYSVNARCLAPDTLQSVRVIPFEGHDWESNAGDLAHLSR